MMSLNDAMLKKQQEPAFAAEWDTLEPEEQIVRVIIEGREENHLTQNQLAHATGIHQTNISSSKAARRTRRCARSSVSPRGWGESSSWNSFPRSRIPTSDNLIFPLCRASMPLFGCPALFLSADKKHKKRPFAAKPIRRLLLLFCAPRKNLNF